MTITTITNQGNGLGVYRNSAVGAGDPPTGPANRVVDDSTDGPDPDADGDNSDGSMDGDDIPDENTPTTIVVVMNQPPVAVPDSAVTPLNTPVTFSATGNDTDSDGIIAPATVDLDPATPGRQTTRVIPGEGTYTVDDSGNVTFTPAPGFTGTSTLPYTVNDNDGLTSNIAMIRITVGASPVNNPPVAVDDRETTTPSTPVIVAVLDNDSDADGDTLTVTQVTQPPSGTATLNPDGTITYTPAPDTVGPVMFPYTISDGRGGTATATVTIDLTDVFDPPIGLKVADADALPQLEWTMVWINAGNVEANAVQVTDDIPSNTTYVAGSLICTPRGTSTVDRCAFDAAVNRVVYEGTIGPDPGLRTEDDAANEVVITYRVAVPPDFFGTIENQAEANWDTNGNGTVADERAAGQTRVVTDDPVPPGDSDPTIVTIEPPDDSDDSSDDTEGGDDPSEGGIDSARAPNANLSQ